MIDRLVSNRYRIVSLIGSGGMANVYKAFDQKEQRYVALKVLKEEHREDADFVRRFEREAKAVLSLSQENIVRSYDVGEDGDLYYIVLEFVEGSTLKETIKEQGALSPKYTVHIAAQVLDALGTAHSNNIIHRDVKPQNVIITPKGKAMLTDFGIARDAAATTRTFAGTSVIGSVHYLSPEQARGDAVDVESDIYSCAIMIYEMLTGEVPFAGDNSVAIALKHLQEDIKPPAEVNNRIPRALSDVVVKAASKQPEQRYHSAQEFKEDLQRALREPLGRFAKRKMSAYAGKRKNRFTVGNIVIGTIIIAGLFTALMFSFRAFSEARDSQGTEFIVPMLTGKSLEQAEELAKKRGFGVEVTEYASSDEYSAGMVLSQLPTSGIKGREGDTITVVVSTGSDYTTVPTVTGMSLQDAILALADSELSVGDTNYITSDLPEGQIIKQEPAEGATVFIDDKIDLWISGQPDNNIEMPSFTGRDLSAAVEEATQAEFSHIWVRAAVAEEKTEEEYVFKQNPAAGMSVNKNAIVELWVNRSFLGAYATDIAFNLDIIETEKTVVVTAVIPEGYEVLLYESTMPAGLQQPISFTAYLRREGEFECKVYINGEEVRSTTAIFASRSK